MPEYSYRCEDCRKSFAITMGMKEHGTAVVTCPKCSSKKVRQKINQFTPITSKKS